MRVARHKKELYFFGWALISGLLLVAAARADDSTYGTKAAPTAVGPFPANTSNTQEILRRARGTLPADQYDAFEKAMKTLDGKNAGPSNSGSNTPSRAGPPGEAVIDGSGIPSVISFDRPGTTTTTPPGQPVQQPVAVQPAAGPERAPAEAPPLPSTGQPPQPQPPPAPANPAAKPSSKASKPTQFYDPSLPSPDPVK